jgi:hypothetical protein
LQIPIFLEASQVAIIPAIVFSVYVKRALYVVPVYCDEESLTLLFTCYRLGLKAHKRGFLLAPMLQFYDSFTLTQQF